MSQYIGLALGSRRPVASHRGEDKGGAPSRKPIVDHRFSDLINIGNSAAAHANRDPRPASEPRIHRRRPHRRADGSADIRQRSARKILSHPDNSGQLKS